MTTVNAAQKTIICALSGLTQTITFNVPQKPGDLPKLDFDYPIQTTTFSLRDGNLLLVAMDEEDKSRLRLLISAQGRNKKEYIGQFMADFGGNQLQIDNGPVSCKFN